MQHSIRSMLASGWMKAVYQCWARLQSSALGVEVTSVNGRSNCAVAFTIRFDAIDALLSLAGCYLACKCSSFKLGSQHLQHRGMSLAAIGSM